MAVNLSHPTAFTWSTLNCPELQKKYHTAIRGTGSVRETTITLADMLSQDNQNFIYSKYKLFTVVQDRL